MDEKHFFIFILSFIKLQMINFVYTLYFIFENSMKRSKNILKMYSQLIFKKAEERSKICIHYDQKSPGNYRFKMIARAECGSVKQHVRNIFKTSVLQAESTEYRFGFQK